MDLYKKWLQAIIQDMIVSWPNPNNALSFIPFIQWWQSDSGMNYSHYHNHEMRNGWADNSAICGKNIMTRINFILDTHMTEYTWQAFHMMPPFGDAYMNHETQE